MRKALLANLFYSVDSICYKKSMSFAKISEFLFTWLREFWGLVIAIVFIFVFKFSFQIITRQLVGGILLILVVYLTWSAWNQAVYRKEKLSAILPYESLYAVFTIIAGFIIFRDTSVWAFVVALITFLVILAFSIDFKNQTLPKNMKMVILIHLFIAMELILTWRVLQSVSNIEYVIVYQFLIIVVISTILLAKKRFSDIKKTSLPFHAYTIGGALSNNIAWIIYLFMIGELGVVMSTLLGFLWTGVTILFGRIFLKEKPTKKNLLMCVIVGGLVGLGFLLG